ncbi:MAG TPA: cadherin domain-containing protein [Ramlibacter sp.]|uniref:cadherin domain-containing protein n=1 Tax=Ramlibacter sp. TaxID=1917967 RepID=UPI002CFF06FA|nr:cadherin domain-containing protein [Ramlibacter sp.]HVZ42273.1 cadherin domain-containing protein [Ramlibacter sp.]
MAIYNGSDLKNDNLTGSSGADTIDGKAGNDTLSGGAGDDTLIGGTGVDSMSGGSGNDTYYVDNIADKVVETGSDTKDVVFTTVSYTQPLNVETMTLQDAGGAISGTGNSLANTMNGNASANLLDGLAGNDIIDGKGGNDMIVGGLGVDSLTGGSGNDTFTYYSYNESPATSNQWDTIVDLGDGASKNANDRIDVSQLDPNVVDGSYIVGGPNFFSAGSGGIYDYGAGGPHTGFSWIGSSSFHANMPGEARYDPGTGLVQLSNDNDVEPEFAVFVGKGLSVDWVYQHLIIQDDIGPTFTTPGPATNPIVENTGKGVTVYDANTDDPRTTFELGGEDSGLFNINSVTGVVTLKDNVDYEASDGGKYHFTVIAIDHAGNQTTSDVLDLNVIDADEFHPVFSLGGEDTSSASLCETNSGLSASGTVTVTDGDPTDEVHVSVESVTHDGPSGGLCDYDFLSYFSASGGYVDADGEQSNIEWTFDSGCEAFDFLACGETLELTYTLHAVDNGVIGGPLGSTEDQTVTVTIHGKNDAPEITCGPYIDAHGVHFTVVDPDDGAELSYSAPFCELPGPDNGCPTTLAPCEQDEVLAGQLSVTDGYTSTDVGVFVGLGTSGGDTIESEGCDPAGLWGFGGNDRLTGGEDDDVLVGGTGRDTMSGGDGCDTFYLADGDFSNNERIDGGDGEDQVVLTGYGVTVDFDHGVLSNVETLAGSCGEDVVTVSADQWESLNKIDLADGEDTLNVSVVGIETLNDTPQVCSVENGSLLGSVITDVVTLSGEQLDSIVRGDGVINLDGGLLDTLFITSTSAALNQLGSSSDAGVNGVEIITAENASAGVTIDLSAQTEGFVVTGSDYADRLILGSGDDWITGGKGADTITGSSGDDRFFYDHGDTVLSYGGGVLSGFDVIQDGFQLGTSNDVIDFEGVAYKAASTSGKNGTDSTLTIAGQTVKSHAIDGNGVIHFDDADTYSAGLALTSASDVAAVVQYLQNNNIDTNVIFLGYQKGGTVMFSADIDAVHHSYVYIQGSNTGTDNSADILIDLEGVNAAGIVSLIGDNSSKIAVV